MQSRMIARRCAIPYALAHPARTRLNTAPILPTLSERIEQSRPPDLFQRAIARVRWTDFIARGGIPPDSFLAAPTQTPRRTRLASVPWSRTDFEGMLRRRNTGSEMRWTKASAMWPESAPGLETCRGSVRPGRNRKEGRRARVRIASGKAFARQPQHPQQ